MSYIKPNHLFMATVQPTIDDREMVIVSHYGKDKGHNRLDAELHLLREYVNNRSKIIEVNGDISKDQAYSMATYYATEMFVGLPVFTHKEYIAYMQSVNKKARQYQREAIRAINNLVLPKPVADDLRTELLEAAKDEIENWRGYQVSTIPISESEM